MLQLATTTTADGLELQGLATADLSTNTIVIHIHGMQGNFFESLRTYFDEYEARGIALLAGENRGAYIAKRFKTSGGGRVVGGAYEIFEECVHDIKAWIDYAALQGYQNIWLASHSLAPAKAAYYMYKTADPRVKGLIFLSPSDNVGLVKDPEGGAADHALCLPEAQTLHTSGKGSQLLSHLLWGDKLLSADTYLSLFSDDSSANVFHYYNPTRSWEVVNSLSVPVIAITGTNDDGITPVIQPNKAMVMLEPQLVQAPRVKTYVLEGADHSFVGYEQRIVHVVAGFIEN